MRTLFEMTSIDRYIGKKITVIGYVTRVIYSSDNDKPFTVALIKGRVVKDKHRDELEFKFKCNFALQETNYIKIHGMVVKDKFGVTVHVDKLTYEVDSGNIEKYLTKNKMFKRIGKATARKLVEACDGALDFEDKLLNDTDELIRLSKVRDDIVFQLKDAWSEMRNLNNVVLQLTPFNLTIHQVQEYYKVYSDEGIEEILDNPFIAMYRIKRFKFKRADHARSELGYPEDMPERINALVGTHVDDMARSKGNTWIDYEEFMESVIFKYNAAHLRKQIEDAISSNNRLRVIFTDTELRITPIRLFNREASIARMIKHFVGSRIGNINNNVLEDYPQLSQTQKRAIVYATSNGISIITGGAGTGKTYTTNTVIKIYEDNGMDVLLMAPTGKAAKRMEELTGRKAMTVHRALMYNGTEFEMPETVKFTQHLIIIDEASMLDVVLFDELLRRINPTTTAVVIVGDHNQLPSIGPGNVLKNLIDSKTVPTTKLNHVFRQAGTLKLNSTEILDGKVNQSEPNVWEVEAHRHITPSELTALIIDKYMSLFDPMNPTSVKLLSPYRIGDIGTNNLNKLLQRVIQSRYYHTDIEEKNLGKITLHDIVIQTVNDYDLDVMNGTVGVVEDIGKDDDGNICFYVRFEKHTKTTRIEKTSEKASNLDLAYALTIHKVQGSEFETVIIIQHHTHTHMLNKNLIYTAVTRAQKKVVLFVDHMLTYALMKQAHDRQTFLEDFMTGELNSEELIIVDDQPS